MISLPHLRPPALGPLSRRQFLIHTFMGAGIAATGPLLTACGGGGSGATLPSGSLGDIGPLGEPDANGIRLPAGFKSRVIAESGFYVPILSELLSLLPLPYVWHQRPDGGATFAAPDGGWVYVSNSETNPAGGVGVLRFDAAGEVADSYSICRFTRQNCAGGPTPWGTWLTCEEVDDGRVIECFPFGSAGDAKPRLALGIFKHEAAAVDPVGKAIYLTEDTGDSRLYRFVPSAADWPAGAARPALEEGELQIARLVGFDYDRSVPGQRWSIEWTAAPSPDQPQREHRREGDTEFKRGEGMWYASGIVYFTTTGDRRLWAYDTRTAQIEIVYDQSLGGLDPVLDGPDNVTVAPGGDVLIAEDNGGPSRIVVVTPQGKVLPLLQLIGQDHSEVTGPAFSPDGSRLYFSSQRGGRNEIGITYEITGPFKV